MGNIKTIIYIVFFLSSLSCIGQSKKTDTPNSIPNENWQIAFNQPISTMTELYFPNAVGIYTNKTVRGEEQLNEQYDFFKTGFKKVKKISTHFSVQVSDQIRYEIGTFEVKDGRVFSHFILWNKTNNLHQREVEIIFEKTGVNDVLKEIKKARENWMVLCNAHNHEQLVKTMYTSDALYYNRGRLLTGTEEITAEYQYMSRPNYSLKLSPLHVHPVDSNHVFEIGQCSGSYNNPYMIVWQKQATGDWQVFFDSND